jgi:hypothetical protein
MTPFIERAERLALAARIRFALSYTSGLIIAALALRYAAHVCG